jgi:hypothetical protein
MRPRQLSLGVLIFEFQAADNAEWFAGHAGNSNLGAASVSTREVVYLNGIAMPDHFAVNVYFVLNKTSHVQIGQHQIIVNNRHF